VWASATPPGLPTVVQDPPGEVARPDEAAVAVDREHIVASRLSELLQ